MADDDILPEAQIFRNRARMFPKKCSEEFEKLLKEAKEMVSNSTKIEEVEEITLLKTTKRATEDTELIKPTKKGKLKKTKKKGIQGSMPEFTSLDNEGIMIEIPPKLPARAKRLLNKLEKENEKERKRLEAQSKHVLSISSSFDTDEVIPVDSESPINIETHLKISYLSDIFKITCKKKEKFASIYSKVADLLKLKASEMLLCFNDENIQMDDTPLSLNLKIGDIVECIPYKPEYSAESKGEKNVIQIKIQSSDCRRRIEMYFHKLAKMKEIMEKYSEMRGIPLENLVFEFDGEKVDGSETLEELEIESGSCLDVKIISEQNAAIGSPSPVLIDIGEDDNSEDDDVLSIVEVT